MNAVTRYVARIKKQFGLSYTCTSCVFTPAGLVPVPSTVVTFPSFATDTVDVPIALPAFFKVALESSRPTNRRQGKTRHKFHKSYAVTSHFSGKLRLTTNGICGERSRAFGFRQGFPPRAIRLTTEQDS
jgi:hypothetical protein